MSDTEQNRTQSDSGVPLLHDDFERCDQCGDIVLMHGRGECLELDDAVYCPRHARPHMDEEEYQLRWGRAMELLNAIRQDGRKAIKYQLVDGVGNFYAVHRERHIYEVWRKCDTDDEQNFTTYSESSLVRNIERRCLVGSYYGDPPHLVSVARAPINVDTIDDSEVIRLAY